jgi:hypothetical protein
MGRLGVRSKESLRVSEIVDFGQRSVALSPK